MNFAEKMTGVSGRNCIICALKYPKYNAVEINVNASC